MGICSYPLPGYSEMPWLTFCTSWDDQLSGVIAVIRLIEKSCGFEACMERSYGQERMRVFPDRSWSGTCRQASAWWTNCFFEWASLRVLSAYFSRTQRVLWRRFGSPPRQGPFRELNQRGAPPQQSVMPLGMILCRHVTQVEHRRRRSVKLVGRVRHSSSCWFTRLTLSGIRTFICYRISLLTALIDSSPLPGIRTSILFSWHSYLAWYEATRGRQNFDFILHFTAPCDDTNTCQGIMSSFLNWISQPLVMISTLSQAS